MDLMKKLSISIFLILMWCNVSFAEWINFTSNDPAGMHTYFDTTSIKTSNGYTQVVTMTDSPTPGPDGILSFKVSYNFNCSSFSAKIMKAESFTKNMGKGEGTSREVPEGWIDFDLNSVTYNLGKHICNL